ncbi:MAG: extracellular solute-binding protein, partial [Betaproteobacteria bacterium]
MFETLCVAGADEPATIYGMLAEEMQVAPDLSSITFRIHPLARFNNGDAVTADDVKYSFDVLTSKLADPLRRSRLAGTQSATVLDARTIRFELKDRSSSSIINLGTRLPVFSRKWGPGPDGQPKPFDQIINEQPVTSGPYNIEKTDSGRRIDFVRRPDYWARDLGVVRGFFNFDHIAYRYYQDGAVGMEAFKAGEFDLIQEYSARRWVRQHAGVKWRDGRIRKQLFPHGFGAGLQAYFMNLRRPIFQDRRVREALIYSYDFMTVNSYRQYKRENSMFSNSEFAATGMPGPGELALLEPFRAKVPPEVFGPAWEAPRTDTDPNALRQNLLKARALLEAAGWKIAADGVLRNIKGEAFEFEYLDDIGKNSKFEVSWQRNLDKLGIRMKRREVDFSIMVKRIEAFDYDVTQIRTADFTLPKIGELRDEFSSATATAPGSSNYSGIKNPVIDKLLDVIANAPTYEALRDACRALDRVIMQNFYAIPDLYSGRYPVSYWDKFGMPAKLPKYFTIDSALDIWPAIAVTTWWIKDPARR